MVFYVKQQSENRPNSMTHSRTDSVSSSKLSMASSSVHLDPPQLVHLMWADCIRSWEVQVGAGNVDAVAGEVNYTEGS